MMKSFFKKLAFVMALAMVVTLAAPAAQTAAAATQFTYAYQNGGAVTELYMEAGDEVDLRFIGVKNHTSYDLAWKSANPLVATVNTAGVVKAVENGTTTIELVVGDKSVYTSTPIKVVVGQEIKVALGTSADNTFAAATVEVGTALDLGFFGVPNYSTTNYSHTWISNAPEVAKVDQKGVVSAVASGSAVITVAIVDNVTGETLNVTPVTITVPTPVVELAYEVKQVSESTAKLTFNDDVNFTKNDVSLEIVYDGGFTATWPIKDFECKGNTITFAPYVPFQDGDNFIIKVGADDEGTPFSTKIGQVDQVIVTYKTVELGDMGNNKAYTNGEDGAELTVQMSAKLYSQGVDVSNVYSAGDVVYNLAQENEYAMIDEYAGTIVFSKAGVPVTVLANYVYYDENDEEKKVPTVVEMTSEMAPAYTVTGVKAWTIATGNEIDWAAPKHTVPAYDGGTIVALITDNYGNVACTADGYTHKNAGTVQNYSESRFANEGYYVTYSSANVEKLLVGYEGTLTTYTQTAVPAIFALRNYSSEADDQMVRNIYAGTVTVREGRRLDKITVSTGSLTLVTDGEFTEGEFEVKAFDQYGGAWTNAETLEITCSVANTTNVPVGGSFAEKQTFYLDGSEIDCTKSTFTLTCKVGGKTASVKVNLKDPKYFAADEDGLVDDIKVTSYQLEAKGASQTIAKEADGTSTAAKITYYTLSNGYKVGTKDDVVLATSANDLKLTTATATKGDQYIVVYYPNGNIVGAENAKGLGVVETGAGKYEVVVANAVDGQMQYDATGTYTVKVLQVSSFNKKDEAVFSTKYSSNFKIENTNKAVALMKQEKLEATSGDIKEIVAETLKFTLGGAEWKEFTAAMVASAKVVENEESDYIVITEVTINVPLNGSSDSTYYTVKVPVNKAVKVPAEYDWAE